MLGEIARRAYFDHFKYLWEDDGEEYVARSFNNDVLTTELESPDNIYFAARFDGEPAGFLKLRPRNTLPMFGDTDAFEIERIYLAKEFKGKGIGKRMMITAIGVAEEMGKQIVWLKVMESNKGTVNFYESFGFSICGNANLTLPKARPEHSGMYVMRKIL